MPRKTQVGRSRSGAEPMDTVGDSLPHPNACIRARDRRPAPNSAALLHAVCWRGFLTPDRPTLLLQEMVCNVCTPPGTADCKLAPHGEPAEQWAGTVSYRVCSERYPPEPTGCHIPIDGQAPSGLRSSPLRWSARNLVVIARRTGEPCAWPAHWTGDRKVFRFVTVVCPAG